MDNSAFHAGRYTPDSVKGKSFMCTAKDMYLGPDLQHMPVAQADCPGGRIRLDQMIDSIVNDVKGKDD